MNKPIVKPFGYTRQQVEFDRDGFGRRCKTVFTGRTRWENPLGGAIPKRRRPRRARSAEAVEASVSKNDIA